VKSDTHYRLYVGDRHATELCCACFEKMTRNDVFVVAIVPRQDDPDVYHRTCFEDRFETQIELVGLIRKIERSDHREGT